MRVYLLAVLSLTDSVSICMLHYMFFSGKLSCLHFLFAYYLLIMLWVLINILCFV